MCKKVTIQLHSKRYIKFNLDEKYTYANINGGINMSLRVRIIKNVLSYSELEIGCSAKQQGPKTFRRRLERPKPLVVIVA